MLLGLFRGFTGRQGVGEAGPRCSHIDRGLEGWKGFPKAPDVQRLSEAGEGLGAGVEEKTHEKGEGKSPAEGNG